MNREIWLRLTPAERDDLAYALELALEDVSTMRKVTRDEADCEVYAQRYDRLETLQRKVAAFAE